MVLELLREPTHDSKSVTTTRKVAATTGPGTPYHHESGHRKNQGPEALDSALAGILMAVMPLTTLLLAHFH